MTDAQGRFFFDELVPGSYKVVANQYSFPTERAPFLEIFWPPGASEAETVELQAAHLVQECDFHLPAAPRGEKVSVKAVFADGTPAAGADIIVRLNQRVYAAEEANSQLGLPQVDLHTIGGPGGDAATEEVPVLGPDGVTGG